MLRSWLPKCDCPDHHLWRRIYTYEGSARIPFIVVPPLGEERSIPSQLDGDQSAVVELRDVMPTLLDAAGLPIPDTVDGCSVLPLLQEKATHWRDYIHGEHCTCYSEEQEMQFVTDGKRKLIWFPRMGSEQFFDLEADPGEVYNLIEDPARQDEIRHWRGFLVQELEERDCGWVKDGKPYCPNDEPLVAPYKNVRWWR